MVFHRVVTECVKDKRKELGAKIQRAKMDFKNEVENQFCTDKHMEGLNTMMGRMPKRQDDGSLDSPSFVNDLNRFYRKFDTTDFKDVRNVFFASVPRNPTIQLSEEKVGTFLLQIKPHKAPGPDGLHRCNLKMYSFGYSCLN